MNIYYDRKELIRNGPPINQKAADIAGQIDLESVRRLFKSKVSGVGLASADVPFDSFDWRSNDLMYTYKEIGEVYIPKNLCLMNGKQKYFFVYIDDALEVVSWPWNGLMTGSREKILHKNLVVSEAEFKPLLESFQALVDFLGLRKSAKEKYSSVKGLRIKKSSLEALISKIFQKNCDDQTEMTQLLNEAATDPVAFFAQHSELMEELEIEEPSNDLFKLLLCALLKQKGRLVVLDWKLDPPDVADAVTRLSDQKIKLSPVKDSRQSSSDLLKSANVQLAQHKQALAHIQLDSDSYNLIMVPLCDWNDITQLAKDCKLKIVLGEEG